MMKLRTVLGSPLLVLIVACGSAEDSGSPATPSSSHADAGVEAEADATTASLDTIVRVHYPSLPALKKSFTLRGDAPLEADHGTKLEPSGEKYVYETHLAVASTLEQVEFRVWLDDEKPSRGAPYVVKPGDTLDLYPYFLSDKGHVKKLFPAFQSKAMAAYPENDGQIVWAYLPPSYSENTLLRYPVVYMHDGQNLWNDADSTTGSAWHADTAIDQAIDSGAVAELIVIAPEHGTKRQGEYAPVTDPNYPQSNPAQGPSYLSMLVDELKPAVDGALRTRTGRENTGVLGSSLGGLMSAYEGLMHPEVFGLVGAMSPSVFWNADWIAFQISNQSQAQKLERLYVDQGSDEDGSLHAPLIVVAYQKVGYVLDDDLKYFREDGGHHDEIAWGRRLPGALAFLLPATRGVSENP